MANQEHLKIIRQGVKVWNQWREKHADIQPDLGHTNLRGADLRDADLQGANLFGTDLRGADLSGAKLRHARLICASLSGTSLNGADLSGAHLTNHFHTEDEIILFGRAALSGVDFSNANLSNAKLMEANLQGANLSHARLSNANLLFADLSGTDFSGAVVGWTEFAHADFLTAKGLETVTHEGPSHFSISSFLRSQGVLPEAFLRGGGLNEIDIANLRSLGVQPVGYYTCFVSYSSKDQAFAERIYADLQSNGVRCWFAPEDLKIGDKIRLRIDEGIRLYDKLLLVLSECSISSQWVEQEVETAMEKERKEGRIVLFPIRLDKTVMEIEGGWPALIRNTRHIGDFTCWKDHSAYQKAFERLLRDLTTVQDGK